MASPKLAEPTEKMFCRFNLWCLVGQRPLRVLLLLIVKFSIPKSGTAVMNRVHNGDLGKVHQSGRRLKASLPKEPMLQGARQRRLPFLVCACRINPRSGKYANQKKRKMGGVRAPNASSPARLSMCARQIRNVKCTFHYSSSHGRQPARPRTRVGKAARALSLVVDVALSVGTRRTG